MALAPFSVSLTACFVFVVILHKMLALLMLGSLGNIFGLPDYVIGELLSSSHMLSKERPIDATSGQSLDQSSSQRHQRTSDWDPPDDAAHHPRNVNMLYSGPGITLLGEDVLIRNSFPGRISEQAVRIRTISESSDSVNHLSVKSHFFTPAEESRFTFESANHTNSIISDGDNVIGNVYFDPTACKKRVNCDSVSSYTGFQAAIDTGVVYDDGEQQQLKPEEVNEWGSSSSRSESRHLLWSNGHSLDQDSIELEVKMYHILCQRWNQQQQRHSTTVNVTLNLETDSGHLLSVATSATLNWPKLVTVPHSLIQFPLTKFGSSTRREVFIENPSSHPLSIQAVIVRPSLYPEDFLTSLSTWSPAEFKDMDPGHSFKLSILNSDGTADEMASVTRVVTIPVGQRIRLGIFFEPLPKSFWDTSSSSASRSPPSSRKSSLAEASTRVTSLLLIRNNLTIFDSLRLEGESGQGLLRIGKEAPGLTSMLTLDLTDKHVNSKCKIRNSKAAAASAIQASLINKVLMFQRDFTIFNFGKIPVTVRGYLIGPHVGVSSSSYKSKSTLASLSDEPIGSNDLLANLIGKHYCEGFGFRILNCGLPLIKNSPNVSDISNDTTSTISSNSSPFEPYTLKPNASRKISIAFTPDFTIAKSMATLTLITDDGPHEEDFSRNWTEVLRQHFLPSSSVIASGRKWFSILTTGSSGTTRIQKWMWGHDISSSYSHRLSDSASKSRPSGGDGSGVNRGANAGLHLITYSLIATVPKSILSACEQSLPRPYQEMILYYTFVVFMICLVVVTCAFAFIDGTRVLNFSFYPVVLMTRPANEFDATTMGSFKPFDLNAAAADACVTDGHQKPSGSSCGWTTYLKNKLLSHRRGSTGSSASSDVSGDGSSSRTGTTGIGANGMINASHEAKSGSKKKRKDAKSNSTASSSTTMTETAVSSLRRRLSAKTWFETLSTRVREEKETVKPVPLPTFEDEFDDQDIQNLKGQKGKIGQKVSNKKDVTPIVVTSSMIPSSCPSSSSTGTSTTSGSSSPIVTPAVAAIVVPPVCVAPSATSSITAAREQLLLLSSSARTSPKTTTLLSSPTYGGGGGGISSSFELPYNPGKGRRCESLSAVPSDPFCHNGSCKESPVSEFGFWDPENCSSSKSSATDNNMEIWDSPITMFDPQMALRDLSKKQAAATAGEMGKHVISKQKHADHQSAAGASKSSLCGFAPPASAFPPVGLFDPSLVHRPVQTPSPRGWSPSHKSLQASHSVPACTDDRTTPSPIAAANLWEAEKDVLSRLRESSTDWVRGLGPNRVTTPVQRPHQTASSPLWPDVAPGGGRFAADLKPVANGLWPTVSDAKLEASAERAPISQSSASSSWNPLSGGSSGFTLFGRSLWSPIPPPGITSPTSPDASGWSSSNNNADNDAGRL